MFIYIVSLFFIIAPKQFVTLPSLTSTSTTINLTHAVIFGLIYWLTHKMVWNISNAYLNPDDSPTNSQKKSSNY
jgi:hypothetical protein